MAQPVVYLVHLVRPYRHARHFLGWAEAWNAALRSTGHGAAAADRRGGQRLDRDPARRDLAGRPSPRAAHAPLQEQPPVAVPDLPSRVLAEPDAVAELALATLAALGRPATVPTIIAALRDRRGGRPVGSLQRRLALLAPRPRAQDAARRRDRLVRQTLRADPTRRYASYKGRQSVSNASPSRITGAAVRRYTRALQRVQNVIDSSPRRSHAARA